MKKVKNTKVPEEENTIDARVENQALDDAAWENEAEVSPRLRPRLEMYLRRSLETSLLALPKQFPALLLAHSIPKLNCNSFHPIVSSL
jgi:hypothetical protein